MTGTRTITLRQAQLEAALRRLASREAAARGISPADWLREILEQAEAESATPRLPPFAPQRRPRRLPKTMVLLAAAIAGLAAGASGSSHPPAPVVSMALPSAATLAASTDPEARPIDGDTAALLKLAENGDAAAQHNLAFRYLTGRGGLARNPERAVAWFRRAADQGVVNAQFALAVLIDEGARTTEERREALVWLQRAAQAEHPHAQYRLARAIAEGRAGAAPSPAEAAPWFARAAEQGIAAAQLELARLYESGTGVPRSPAYALHWYELAAAGGEAAAAERLVQMRRR